jgi:hypothetical protein
MAIFTAIQKDFGKDGLGGEVRKRKSKKNFAQRMDVHY